MSTSIHRPLPDAISMNQARTSSWRGVRGPKSWRCPLSPFSCAAGAGAASPRQEILRALRLSGFAASSHDADAAVAPRQAIEVLRACRGQGACAAPDVRRHRSLRAAEGAVINLWMREACTAAVDGRWQRGGGPPDLSCETQTIPVRGLGRSRARVRGRAPRR